MLVDNKKIIFIHCPRTGGTSMEAALRSWLSSSSLEKKINKYKHLTIEKYKKALGDEFKRYWSFAFVRNPWDMQLSLYCQTGHSGDRFDLWLNRNKRSSSRSYQGRRHHNQLNYISLNGRTIVDYVGRYETLHEDWKYISSKLNITEDLPHLNKTNSCHYRQYYNAKSKGIVAKLFSKDIEHFGYSY